MKIQVYSANVWIILKNLKILIVNLQKCVKCIVLVSLKPCVARGLISKSGSNLQIKLMIIENEHRIFSGKTRKYKYIIVWITLLLHIQRIPNICSYVHGWGLLGYIVSVLNYTEIW